MLINAITFLQFMNILPNIKIVDLALFFDSTIVIADVHIGYEEALNKQGVLVPRLQFEDMARKIEKILKQTGKVERVIINGDLKHEFGTISEQEWRNTLKFLDLLAKSCNELLLILFTPEMLLHSFSIGRTTRFSISFGDVPG